MLRWTLTNRDTGAKYVLQRDPKGWDELQLTHNRSEKYHGFFFDFSLELAFSCNGQGKELIDAAYDARGSEANVDLLVEVKCPPVGWTIMFNGKLNYSTYKQEFRGKVLYSVLDIIKKGITQQVKNREGTEIDICSTESIGGVALNSYNYSCYDLNLHSKLIKAIGTWEYLEEATEIPELGGIQADLKPNPATGSYTILAPRPFLTSMYVGTGIPVQLSDIQESFDGIKLAMEAPTANANDAGQEVGLLVDTNLQSDFIGRGPYDVLIEWDFCGDWSDDLVNGGAVGRGVPSASGDIALFLVIGTQKPTTDIFSWPGLISNNIDPRVIRLGHIAGTPTGTVAGYSTTFLFSGSATATINLGDKIWLMWVYPYQVSTVAPIVNEVRHRWIYCEDTFLRITIDSQTDPTTAKAVAIHEAWSRVCEGITDQTLAFKSEFFGRTNSQGLAYGSNGYGSFTAITDGLRIRGFTQSDTDAVQDGFVKKGIITTLKDIFKSCNSIWGVGLGIEDLSGTEVVRVEEVDYFYSDTKLLRLSNIPNLQMSFTKGFAGVKVGFEKWKINEYNGLDEVCTTAKWTFPIIKSLDDIADFISEYVASAYALEFTRRQNITAGYGTKDTSYDDDIFIIALNRNVNNLNTAEKNENITATNVVDPPSSYNLRFNLFSSFDRVMNQFSGVLTKEVHSIKQIYSEGNANALFQFNDAHPGDLNGNQFRNVQDTAYPNSFHRRGDPILLPETYTFTYPLKFTEYLAIVSNPYGFIEFSEGSQTFKKGYIKTLNFNLRKKIGDFTLIRKYE